MENKKMMVGGVIAVIIVCILFVIVFQSKSPHNSALSQNPEPTIPAGIANGTNSQTNSYSNQYFSLMYPSSWTPSPYQFTGGQGISFLPPAQGNTVPPEISIDVYPTPGSTTATEKENLYLGLGFVKKSGSIAGQTAEVLQGTITPKDFGPAVPVDMSETQYYVFKGAILFVVKYKYPSSQQADLDTIQTILSSLHFN